MLEGLLSISETTSSLFNLLGIHGHRIGKYRLKIVEVSPNFLLLSPLLPLLPGNFLLMKIPTVVSSHTPGLFFFSSKTCFFQTKWSLHSLSESHFNRSRAKHKIIANAPKISHSLNNGISYFLLKCLLQIIAAHRFNLFCPPRDAIRHQAIT